MAVMDLKKSFSNQVTAGVSSQKELDVITPATTGVAYLIWTRLPDFVPEGFAEMTRVLASQVQIPGMTLAVAEGNYGFNGAGKTIVPTSVESDNTVTITYQEQINLPALNAIDTWMTTIRDPHSGLSKVKNYNLRNISGDLLVVFCKPIMYSSDNVDNIIEKAILYTHCIPTTSPLEVLNSNKESSDKIQFDEPYKFKSQIRNNKAVDDLAKSKLAWAMKTSVMSEIELQS